MLRIEQTLDGVELQVLKLFVFIDNLVFDIVFYKGTSKIPLLFKLVIRLHQVYIRGDSILHVFHITETRMIEAGIDGLSRESNLGGMMVLLNPLQFVLIYQGAWERSTRMEPWVRLWYGDILTSSSPIYWFKTNVNNCIRDGIIFISGSMAPESLQVSPDGGPSTNDIFCGEKNWRGR